MNKSRILIAMFMIGVLGGSDKVYSSDICLDEGASSANSASPSFKEGVLYEVQDPVKEVKTKTKNKFTKKKVKLLESGRQGKSLMFFNKDGYPGGWSMNIAKTGATYAIEYDSLNRVVSTIFKCSIGGEQEEITNYEYKHDEGMGNLLDKARYSVSKDGKVKDIICEYSSYILDDHKKWTSRAARQITVENNMPKDSVVYIETREISYY